LTSDMGEAPLILTRGRPEHGEMRAVRVFQEQQTSGKGLVAPM